MDKCELTPIPGFQDYYASKSGDIFSAKKGDMHKMKTRLDSKGNYVLVSITNNDGKCKQVLVHRIIATCFIPNPENLPEVNHKDRNKQNNNVDNLEWCTRKANMEDSYKTMSPARNTNPCFVYYRDEFVDVFSSIRDALDFCVESYSASRTSLERYMYWGDVSIVPQKTTRKSIANPGETHHVQNRHLIRLEIGGKTIATAKTFTELATILNEKLEIKISRKTLYKYWEKGKLVADTYLIVKEK